jgi:hypothetical protein
MEDGLHTDVARKSVDAIIPYTNNPKEHPDEQVQKIASSIKNYGWDQPIVVDGENEIIKGHGRLQAAQLLGLEEVPVITRTDLSDAEKRASRIADNKTAESAWDDELLTTELDMIQDDFMEIELGFDDGEIDDLMTAVEDRSFLDETPSSMGEPDGDTPSDTANREPQDEEGTAETSNASDSEASSFDSGSINASTFVELTFSVTPEERTYINEVLSSTGAERRRDQLLEVMGEY